MSYNAQISRTNPACIFFLIDQSGSMSDPFGGDNTKRNKAFGVADAINRLLQNLGIKCARAEGIRDYFEVGVIGYGAHVAPAFGGILKDRELIPISQVAGNPIRIEERTRQVEDGAGGLVNQTVRFPVWFDPVADNGTPMCQALLKAQSILQNWIGSHPTSFPPIIINITDGESTDGDPSNLAQSIQQLATNDGNVLLFNVHISSKKVSPIEFPDNEENLPDEHARLLFRCSSILPEVMRNYAQQMGYTMSDLTKGFVFNADMVAVIKFLDIGTKVSDLR